MEQDREEKVRGQDAVQATAAPEDPPQVDREQAEAPVPVEAWVPAAAGEWESAPETVEAAGRAAAAGVRAAVHPT